jgi:hypothetical protein
MSDANRFTRTFTLKQHTPLIHFQHDQPGATLRATELKPKLDRFLIAHFEKEGVDYSKWLINGQKRALNYKVRIIPHGKKDESLPNKFLYFANNAIKNSSQKLKAVRYNNVQLTLFSIHDTLLQAIDEAIGIFFILHNFGARQSKGYGSFFPIEKNFKQILSKIKYPTYKVKYKGGKDWQTKVDYIHKRIKSGINFNEYKKSLLFLYMCQPERKIRWEKRKIKKEFGEALMRPGHKRPARCDNEEVGYDFRFVRALLGLPGNFEYNGGLKRGGEVVNVSHPTIKRFPSPLLYKIYDKDVFIIAKDDYNSILNQNFQFRLEVSNNDNKESPFPKSFSLSTPDRFDIKNFLDFVCDYEEDGTPINLIEKVSS